jgi:phosphoribosylformylglycinamidine synthase PurS subunit
MKWELLVEVRPKATVADPEGATIERALAALGFQGVSEVRVGKALRLSLEAPSQQAALDQAKEMTRRLLANPVIEDAAVSLAPEFVPDQLGHPEGVAGSRERAGFRG